MYFWRSFLVALSVFCSTYGVQHLALADAVVLQYTFPLFTALILWIFYKKTISLRANCALLVGFVAIFFLLKPQWDLFHTASLASLGAAIAAAIVAITLHELMKTEHVLCLMFYCTWIPGCFSLVPFIYSWEWVTPSIITIYLIPSSFLGVIYQILMAKAYSFSPPHVVSSFSYFCVFFSTFFGWLIWDETLDAVKMIGGLLIVLCGFLMVYENHRMRNPRASLSTDNRE